MYKAFEGATVRAWTSAGLAALAASREEIDALNVFPVADRDTGTNLYLTLEAACRELDHAQPAGPAHAVKTLARGALLGARGSSGVILSQLLRGLADILVSAPEFDGKALAAALDRAAALAYEAVAQPVEGTMLTVARAAADRAAATAGRTRDLAEVASSAAEGARAAVEATPKQLPRLAEAGVVDSGGQGLVVLLDTLAALAAGRDPIEAAGLPQVTPVPVPRHDEPAGESASGASGSPDYEVIYLVTASEAAAERLRRTLGEMCAAGVADSLLVVGDSGLWRTHIHVDEPGPAIEAGIAAGHVSDIHVTYLAAGTRHSSQANTPSRAVVALSHGSGLDELFGSAGARTLPVAPGHVIDSAELTAAIRATRATEVIVLPNDPAAVDTAAVAAEVVDADGHGGVRVAVVPARTPVHGIAALAVHEGHRRFDADVVAMTAAAGATRFGGVEVARGEAWTSVGVCRAGDVLGYIEGDIVLIAADQHAAAIDVVERMLSVGGEMVTLVTGEGAAPGVSDAVCAHLRTRRPDVEVVTYHGGQPARPLLVGVE